MKSANFSSASKVSSTISAGQDTERLRAENRVKVNKLFDGFPPMEADVAAKIGVKINVNWLEGKVIEQQGVDQYVTAFTRQANYFKVNLPNVPVDKAVDWSTFITQKLNRPLKKSKKFFNLIKEKSASVVRHGIGPQTWYSKTSWLPSFVAIEDLRIPTDTKTSLDNLMWFGIRKRYTLGEFAEKTFDEEADSGWNKPVVAKILDAYKEETNTGPNYDWSTNPEKMLELYKQDMGFWMSDAVPTIAVWHFFHLEGKGKDRHWELKIVPAEFGVKGVTSDTFIYDGSDSDDKEQAKQLENILHVQFGNLSGKTPFMYHAVRSLGFLLMEPCYWSNLIRCRFLQHVWENFNLLLRGGDPGDRARTQKVELFDKAWLPEGVSIVPQTERHQIDPQLVEFAMAQMKQLMGEASSSYTQDSDTGTAKEQTAFETGVKLNQVNRMMASILNDVSQQETFAYTEIARRFCIEDSDDEDVIKFRKACAAYGIPKEMLDVDEWDITPEMPMGSGNQSIEMAQATQLMAQRGAFNGDAQAEILHIWTSAVTNNPRLASILAPLGQNQKVTDSQRDAEFAFGTMMLGVPVRMKPGLNPVDQVETILGLTAGVIQRIEKSNDQMATEGEIAGLNTNLQYAQGLIAQLAQDPQQKSKVKEYSDSMGQLMNALKGFEQRLQQKQQADSVKENISINYKDAFPSIQRQMEAKAGFVPATEQNAQVDPKTQKAVHGMAIKDAQFQQKQKHSSIAFDQEQERKNAQTAAEIQAKGLMAGLDAAHQAQAPAGDKNVS